MFFKYARTLILAENGFCSFPTPPLYVVEGDAGSGKSKSINVLSQAMEKEFRKAGDDPDHPYILKGSFTAKAATNIKGQTLTSLFTLSFGNKLGGMSDMMRDKKRELLQNLKLLIIDEYSMVKSDMLYQIDQRLKEIMVSQENFGGIAVILLGNLLQLQPVKGRYIFEEPASDQWRFGHQLQSLWEMFVPIKLTYNHRQAGEHRFAELLKRIARGIKTEPDLELLRTRVVSKDDPRIPEDTLYVFPRRKEVKEMNEHKLNLLEEDLVVLKATNILCTKRHFEPYVDEVDGKVRNTPLTNVLYLKKRAKIILIHNIDLSDGLVNGTEGIVLDFLKQGDMVTHVVVELNDKEAGQKLRQSQSHTFLCLYPHGVPIPRMHHTYSINKRKHEEGHKAICIQFPIQLGYAVTTHKIQGDNIVQPKTETTDFSGIFQESQYYTTTSRVSILEGIFILDDIYENKIYTSKKSIRCVERT